ncbi:hypothetical protein AVU43_gp04 [Ralstonia phage RSJ5]|uniref:Uncharacterized protein n=1 Tax=Ralstonia phage RSJ5 TaxID=1538364 RepID=A0A077KVM2_9CAUD|nr:hypothetical protein AVU43_gp04 [Ralstonia phage RSJ5]BAP34898.1 hypothetical protein [Ralstonia phage RSJ5]
MRKRNRWYKVQWYVANGLRRRGDFATNVKGQAQHLAEELVHSFGGGSVSMAVNDTTPRVSWESGDRNFSVTIWLEDH